MRLRPFPLLCLLVVFSFVNLHPSAAGVMSPGATLSSGRTLVLRAACTLFQVQRCKVLGRKCVGTYGHYQDRCWDIYHQCVASCGGYSWRQ